MVRSVATELADLMRISPVTARVAPFIIEVSSADVELVTRRARVRWLHSFFNRPSRRDL